MLDLRLEPIVEALGYSNESGLVQESSTDLPYARQQVWAEAHGEIGVDAAYFLDNIPVAYFKAVHDQTTASLMELHRRLWNHGRAPILIAVTVDTVHVFNCFQQPNRDFYREDSGPQILFSGDLRTRESYLGDLENYSLRSVTRGGLLESGSIDDTTRVDRRLLANLRTLRTLLTDDGVGIEAANHFIGLSLFVRWLEDRGLARSRNFEYGDEALDSYQSVLHSGKGAASRFLRNLSRQLNGDLLANVDGLLNGFSDSQLQLVGQFLSGTEIETGQSAFWAYDFRFIPVDFLSSVYDEFLGSDRSTLSAFYTPPELVRYVVDEIIVWPEHQAFKLLDPACGSGVFLVEAIRKIAFQLRSSSGSTDYDKLCKAVVDSIYGIDISAEAIRISALSCYLALLEHFDPSGVDPPTLPNLINNNLFARDFFAEAAPNEGSQYDIVVGNPPWKSSLTSAASTYLNESNRSVADNQIAQAFMWKSADISSWDGQIALVCPSKPTLFNQGPKARAFRRAFFAENDVLHISELSKLRRDLFRHSTSPATVVKYRRRMPSEARASSISYVTPGNAPWIRLLRGITLDAGESKSVSTQLIANYQDAWKTLLWGTHRDIRLISNIRQTFPTLKSIADDAGWYRGQGVTAKGPEQGKTFYPERLEFPWIAPNKITPLLVSESSRQKNEVQTFNRSRNPRLFNGPVLLIRRGISVKERRPIAAVSDEQILFPNSVLGISGAGDANAHSKLLLVAACISSSVGRYFHWLTSSSWGVERDEVGLAEHLELPIPIHSLETSAFNRLSALTEHIRRTGPPQNMVRELDNIVFEMYGLLPYEQSLIQDACSTISVFYDRLLSTSYDEPDPSELPTYINAFVDVLSGPAANLDLHLEAEWHYLEMHSIAVMFTFRSNSDSSPQDPTLWNKAGAINDFSNYIEEVLGITYARLSELLSLRRHLRGFSDDRMLIIKPRERRFWTESSAINDADETIGAIFRTFLGGDHDR